MSRVWFITCSQHVPNVFLTGSSDGNKIDEGSDDDSVTLAELVTRAKAGKKSPAGPITAAAKTALIPKKKGAAKEPPEIDHEEDPPSPPAKKQKQAPKTKQAASPAKKKGKK